MALTVTATCSGTGTENGTGLAVRVLNNARATVGATATSDPGVPEQAVTPGSTGSVVYLVVINDTGAAATGLLANTTSLQNQSDTTNYLGAYMGKSTSSPASGTSVTYGWSGPSEGGGELYAAAAEIVASGGTLAEDSSTPAAVYTTSAKTAVSASFTPPANALLVALVASNWTGTGTAAPAVTDSSGSYTWSEAAAAVATTGVVQASIWLGVPGGVQARRISDMRVRCLQAAGPGPSRSGAFIR